MKKIFFFALLFISINVFSQSVGIGTASPNASAQLEVASTTKGFLIPRMTDVQRNAIASPVAGLMVYETTSNSMWIYNGAWSSLGTGGASAWATTGNNIYNSNSGNIGVGLNTNINDKLTIKGNILVVYKDANDLTNGGNKAILRLMGANLGGGQVNFLKADSTLGGSIIFTPFSNQFSINNGANNFQLSLHENGGVAIGTATPNSSAALDIRSTTKGFMLPRMTTAQRLDVVTPGIGNVGLLVYDTDKDEFHYSDGTAWRAMLNTRYWFRNVTARDRICNITDSVGIGTASPTERLQVTGNLRVTGTGLIQGEITTNSGLTIDETGGTIQLQDGGVNKGYFQIAGDNVRMGTNSGNSTGDLIFRMNGTDRNVIDNAGNMGIGTLSPASKLHVAGRGLFKGSGEVIAVDGTSNPNIGFYSNGTFKSFISQSPSELYIGVNGGPLHLDATQIAIGAVVSGSTAYKLAVNGKIICEEVKVKLVSSGWPDYVFGNEYKLKPLQDVEKFIQVNKHLPNIPSATEVEKNGIEVGDMQKRMMEKIEELTLYIIDLQKQVTDLKGKTAAPIQ